MDFFKKKKTTHVEEDIEPLTFRTKEVKTDWSVAILERGVVYVQ